MFQIKVIDENKTHFLCSLFFSDNRAVYGIMWKSMVQPDGAQITTWSMCTEYWIRKNTNTHSEYEILIAFPQQQWSHERAPMFHYTSIACLVSIMNISFLIPTLMLSLGPYYPVNSVTFALFRA